jgi:hypothetical protein
MGTSCRPLRRTVAQGPVCTVEECSCGVLHLTLGALTIRIQREVVASMWETLGEALQPLADEGRRPSPFDAGTTRSSATERPS